MANKSAQKRMRTSEKARIRHKARKSALNTSEKNLKVAIEASDLEKSQKIFSETSSAFDRAVKAGIIHKNKANRKKSQLAKLVATLSK